LFSDYLQYSKQQKVVNLTCSGVKVFILGGSVCVDIINFGAIAIV